MIKPVNISITRKIVTGKYENIDITVECIPDYNISISENISFIDSEIMKYASTVRA